MAETPITRKDAREGKTWDAPTGARHTYRLQGSFLHVLEMEDVNFHHNSAVLLPDYGVDESGTVKDSENDASGTGDQVELAGLAAVAACLRYAEATPEAKLVIAGHTDTTGADQGNLELSRLRAKGVHAVLAGKREEWIDVCVARSKVEDYQQILKWVSVTFGWPCDPGKVDNVRGTKTEKAVRAFQESYNLWEDDSRKHAGKVSVDGVVGRQTWGAIFDVYEDTLELLLDGTDEKHLAKFREALRWLDEKSRWVGCGESKPIEAAESDNYESETNRRVEFLFFLPDEAPVVPLKCHASATSCDAGACQIYWKYKRIYLPKDPAFVPRAAYRFTLRLGKIDDLFADAPGTPMGRMARLQTVGLFYFPLRHARASNAFSGTAATAPNAATGHPGNQAFRGTWSYFKTDIVDGASAASPATDAEADADIQRRLESFVVDQGTLPDPVPEGGTPGAANFRKIRVPGGHTFVDAISGLDTNRDPAYAMAMTGSQFSVEDLHFRDNPVLGKIPLVAKVEIRNRRTGQYEPAKDVAVHFQLVPADPLPAYDPTLPANGQINRPPLRESHVGGPVIPVLTDATGAVTAPAEAALPALASGAGPNLRYTTEEARNPDPNDPQGTNCPRDRGGKRGHGSTADGTDVAGVIFETTSRPGFNAAHPGRPLPHKPYPVAAKATPDGEKHRHAVKALTNEEGEAGVIFTPSRMGGDRYRIRAYVGPPTIASDGTETNAVRKETGTFVVWRNLRLTRYYQVVPGDPDPALLAQVSNPATYGITTNAAYRTRVGVQNTPGLNDGNWNETEGSPAPAFAGPVVMWARAWCEFTLDRNALDGGRPHALTDAQYAAARRQALADGIAGQAAVGSNYNLRNLLLLDAAAPALTPATGLTCVPMRTPEAYNAAAGTTAAQRIAIRQNAAGVTMFGATQAHRDRVDTLHLDHMLPGFTRSISENGHLPGFTVIQSAMGCTWQLIGQNGGFSGIAINYRAGHLWYGNTVYVTPARFPYGYDSNMIHEMGHCHYREHAPGRNPNRTPAGGNNPAKHDRQATGICVMSYKTCEGDLCGMCTMGLRGWDIASMTP